MIDRARLFELRLSAIRAAFALTAAAALACTPASKDTHASIADTARPVPLASALSIDSATGTAHINVVAMDYAFRLPASAPPGHTTFHFTNSGKVRHEYNIVLLKPDVTLGQFMAAANKDQPLSSLIESSVGVLFAQGGHSSASTLSTDLKAGRTYAIRCIFKDSASAPRHQALGMFGAINISKEPARQYNAVIADTIVATDYAFQYPATLKPGWHHFVLVNNGKQRHEFAVALLKPGITLKKFTDTDRAGGDVDPLFDDDFGLLHTPAGTSPPATLDVMIQEGRLYLIECEFQDTPKSPEHYKLGMFGSIRGASL